MQKTLSLISMCIALSLATPPVQAQAKGSVKAPSAIKNLQQVKSAKPASVKGPAKVVTPKAVAATSNKTADTLAKILPEVEALKKSTSESNIKVLARLERFDLPDGAFSLKNAAFSRIKVNDKVISTLDLYGDDKVHLKMPDTLAAQQTTQSAAKEVMDLIVNMGKFAGIHEVFEEEGNIILAPVNPLDDKSVAIEIEKNTKPKPKYQIVSSGTKLNSLSTLYSGSFLTNGTLYDFSGANGNEYTSRLVGYSSRFVVNEAPTLQSGNPLPYPLTALGGFVGKVCGLSTVNCFTPTSTPQPPVQPPVVVPPIVLTGNINQSVIEQEQLDAFYDLLQFRSLSGRPGGSPLVPGDVLRGKPENGIAVYFGEFLGLNLDKFVVEETATGESSNPEEVQG